MSAVAGYAIALVGVLVVVIGHKKYRDCLPKWQQKNEVMGILIPTKDPINDRFEIFVIKKNHSNDD